MSEVTLEGGNYDVLRARLEAGATELEQRTTALNDRRKTIFGGQELTVQASERIRTEHNCVPRNLVVIGDKLLLGYNVHFALKKQVLPGDVFSLHRFASTSDGYDLSAVPDDIGLFSDARFQADFTALYQYFADTRLVLVRIISGKLLAVFRTGRSASDIRVFRWALNANGTVQYLDNRGDRDHVWPSPWDFTWTPTRQEDHVAGRFPHINILDTVFVETIGGTLTVKVENNTNDGQGIYAEPVTDPHQSLDDARIAYARIGNLILLSIRPYGEEQTRYLVFNALTKDVRRIDAIGESCVQLPEDHGILFPGGYYLRDGTCKLFSDIPPGMRIKRTIKSPNGEDVLYLFHNEAAGDYVLLSYNLVRQEVRSPIFCQGYSLFDDGRMILLAGIKNEPDRVHPVQIWSTPFCTADFAARQPNGDGSFLSKVGNAELVRSVSDLFALARSVGGLKPSRAVYEELIRRCTRTLDTYHFLDHAETGGIGATVAELRKNGERIIDEFEKLLAIEARAKSALIDAEERQKKLVDSLLPTDWKVVEDYTGALTALRAHQGHLITLKEVRAIDRARIDVLEKATVDAFGRISAETLSFLLKDDALAPLNERLTGLIPRFEAAARSLELEPLRQELAEVGAGLELLIEVVSSLEAGDPNERTKVLERISAVMSQLNRVRAIAEGRRRTLGEAEAKAEFGARFALLSQGVAGALSTADTPEKCDEQAAKLMIQLEELESRFGEFDIFVAEISARRIEIQEAFQTRRQSLQEARQRKAQGLQEAAKRILEAASRRKFASEDALNAWFAADPMVLKVRKIAEDLNRLGSTVQAEELLGKLKALKQQAIRGFRDEQDLYADGGQLIQLGRHQFRVNTRPLELTLVPRGEQMAFHLTGTEYYAPITDPEFTATRPFWGQSVISENESVYRAEYLAASMFFAAEQHQGLTMEQLSAAATSEAELLECVRRFAAPRYEEGYERGVHDIDATRILSVLLPLSVEAGLLRYPAAARALACLWYAFGEEEAEKKRLHQQAISLARLQRSLPHPPAAQRLLSQLQLSLTAFCQRSGLEAADAAPYLARELGAPHPSFVTSIEALTLRDALLQHLELQASRKEFERLVAEDAGLSLRARWELVVSWLEALTAHHAALSAEAIPEAAALILCEGRVSRAPGAARATAMVTGLLGQHPRIVNHSLPLRLDEVLTRLGRFMAEQAPAFRRYRQICEARIQVEKQRLRLNELQAGVMTTFVRNRLINEVYLPLIGDNLARQLGAAGEGKRTDTMGLLLLISPPGYGKTTLMEYIANRLGLIFVKVNGPALGHGITSLDPTEADNAASRQEVEKINLALEMGNNVMLYLDDIQHTNPELLQKFIPLCDATRRIEGVWQGQPRTYDLRGRTFCVVMAGNPYTESGARFQVPDMLTNRADTYNLGDILGGREDLFALSYIENSLVANPVLAPLATRAPGDLQRLLGMAKGEPLDQAGLAHDYSAAEIDEIVNVLQKLMRVQDTLLKVNTAYIRSASTADAFRTEPPFKLQGSYRNMARLASKVVPAMNDAELNRLIEDHYVAESQNLTGSAEQNLLKLAELRGTMTDAQKARWAEIKEAFARNQLMGGQADDPVARLMGAVLSLGQEVRAGRDGLTQAITALGSDARMDSTLQQGFSQLTQQLASVAAPKSPPQSAALPDPTPFLQLDTRADLVMRHAVLMEVQRALSTYTRMQQAGREQLRTGDLILGGTLPVIQELAAHIEELARSHMAQPEPFLEELRRRLARSVSKLSDTAEGR